MEFMNYLLILIYSLINHSILDDSFLIKFFISTGRELLGRGRLNKLLAVSIVSSIYIIKLVELIIITNSILNSFTMYLISLTILKRTGTLIK